jgi:hypothetical protein
MDFLMSILAIGFIFLVIFYIWATKTARGLKLMVKLTQPKMVAEEPEKTKCICVMCQGDIESLDMSDIQVDESECAEKCPFQDNECPDKGTFDECETCWIDDKNEMIV